MGKKKKEKKKDKRFFYFLAHIINSAGGLYSSRGSSGGSGSSIMATLALEPAATSRQYAKSHKLQFAVQKWRCFAFFSDRQFSCKARGEDGGGGVGVGSEKRSIFQKKKKKIALFEKSGSLASNQCYILDFFYVFNLLHISMYATS